MITRYLIFIIFFVAYSIAESANAQPIFDVSKSQSLYAVNLQTENAGVNGNIIIETRDKDVLEDIPISSEITTRLKYRSHILILGSFILLISILLFVAFRYYQNTQSEQRQGVNQLMHKLQELSQQQSSQKEEHKDKNIQELMEFARNGNSIFFTKFNQYFPEFSTQLMTVSSPKLVAKEIEICAMLVLNFETKEIARFTNSTTRSVESRKYRIRKKLQLSSSEDLTLWMQLNLPEQFDKLRSQSVSFIYRKSHSTA